MVQLRSRFIALCAIAAALALVTFGGGRGFAQDATPMATPMAGMAMAHPGHIHTGTCDNLGDVVVPLPDVPEPSMVTAAGTPMAGTPVVGTPMAGMTGGQANPVSAVSTTVDLALTDILAAPHAINYHESAQNIQNYIACGNIGGTPDQDGNLFIGLSEVNGSGYSGVAWLQASGDQTIVTVFLGRNTTS